ncbi:MULTISPECIES: hypothetical protein [Proteus]|nr:MULTISPECIES: hypothetical protein [Proteus]MBG3131427.1 hypothetical protein [Proteus mirabilis]MBI6486122.1 hypothetical protein [Proteus mirabilis]MCO8051935.1 hypothetical protein [Proteus penneri]
MATGICPKCGEPCAIIFRRSVVIDGKVRFPKKGKAFPIPQCGCTEKKAA